MNKTEPFVPTRNALKSILVIILFFITFFAGIQYIFQRRDSVFFKSTFSFISIFGAGVFLATCLLDLLPESLECFERAKSILENFNNFPFPELCIAIGFILVLLVEQLTLYATEKRWISSTEFDHLLNHEHTRNENRHINNESAVENENILNVPATSIAAELSHHTHSSIRVILLVFALSLHAIFEGISLGMILNVTTLLQVSFALLIHKTIIGFSLGIRLVQSKLKKFTIVLCIITFSSQVVIGGFLGIFLVNFVNKTSKITSNFVSGILQAIACGTFLYITCFEILPHELNSPTNRLLKLFFLMFGFILIALLVAVFPA